jgi:hypothetical protein
MKQKCLDDNWLGQFRNNEFTLQLERNTRRGGRLFPSLYKTELFFRVYMGFGAGEGSHPNAKAANLL